MLAVRAVRPPDRLLPIKAERKRNEGAVAVAMTRPGNDSRDIGPHVLREYALLADGERGALIGPRGEISLMCFPRWESDGVFSVLLGGRGAYRITPYERFVWGGYYEDGTLIWRSRWVTDAGIVECREALLFPGDPSRAVLLRRIENVEAKQRLEVSLDVAAGFGAAPLDGQRCEEGVWSGRSGDVYFRWTGAADARPSGDGGGELRMDVEVDAGEVSDFVLELGESELAGETIDPDHAWGATASAWEREAPKLGELRGARDATFAYTVLRGLTSRGHGMVAASTTSLPERAEAGRNYDYRYAWIRDQSFVGQACGVREPLPLLDDAVSFVAARLNDEGPELKPAYTTYGRPVPGQRQLDLPGYPGGGARTGNDAASGFQLDAFGEALLLFATAARHDHLDRDGWQAAETAIEAIRARWQEADAGIWELDRDLWTHSRLTCAAGLRRIAQHAPARNAREWVALADRILADCSTSAVHASGRWQRAPSDERVDCALLLSGIRGAVSADDPRTLATLDACLEELTQDGYGYRFKHERGPLGQAEGAFLLCGFLLSLALWQQGREVDSNRWFERTRAAAGPAGLFSEEFDVRQRQLRGNMPQAFVHALLLETAQRLG